MILAGCIIKDSNGNVLLIHRNTPKRVQWEIPGGAVEPDETPEQAAVREAKEELGITVTVVRQVGSKSFEQDGEHYEYHWFEASIAVGEPRLTNADEDTYDDLGYFSLAEMEQMFDELSANAKNFVQAMQQQEVAL